MKKHFKDLSLKETIEQQIRSEISDKTLDVIYLDIGHEEDSDNDIYIVRAVLKSLNSPEKTKNLINKWKVKRNGMYRIKYDDEFLHYTKILTIEKTRR